MKKLSLFILTLLFSATCVWAADWATTYTEAYADALKAGIQGEERTYTSSVFPHITWNYCKVRIKGDTLPAGKQAIWLNRNVTNYDDANPSYFECAHIEGGVKKLEFKYKQANSGDDNKILCLAIKANDVRIDSIRFTGASGYRNKARSYSKNNLGIKSNTKFTLQNISHEADADYTIIPGRLTLSALTITPYLLYRNKDITIGTKQRGYVNRELLDNTGSSETITYLSSNTSIATVDAETGVVTPVSAGNVTISASLDGGITTITDYTLHVVDGIVAENFSKVVQTGSAPENTPWAGDLFSWKVMSVRRFTNDTIYDYPRVQGTWMAENGGYVQTEQAVEGGIKHIQFDWMQWTDVSSTTIKVSYDGVDKVTDAQTGHAQFDHFTIDEDIDCASEGVLKIYNASPSSPANRITIGAVKITPYLLYTTKSHTIDTRVDALTYTNNDLINNTSGTAVEYSIAPTGSGATINAGTGEVTVTDATEGTFTVTAEWGEVETTYTLTVVSRTATIASYSAPAMHVGLDAISIYNPFTYTPGYDGTIAYSSSNTSVAEINASTGAITVNGVGQTTITATLQQTENYKATSASYILYVRNNNGARVERFQNVTQPGVVGTTLTDWTGDLFTWQAQYQVRRGTNDTIHAETTKHQGTSIGIQDPTGTPKSSILQSKDVIEGGIKYLSFYWMQWGAASNCTRRIVVYADGTKIGEQEHPNGTEGRSGDEFLLGINNAMKSNKQLIIKNESYKGSVETLADNACRIVLDNIYITPYLLYTTKNAELDMRVSTTYTNNGLINNTGGGTIDYSLDDNDGEATIDTESGEVTALKAGEVTVKATWREGGASTWYTLTITSVTETSASYANPAVRLGLGATVPENELTPTAGYDGEITYSSSNPAVATVNLSTGAVTLAGGVGQTTITASLSATTDFTATTASYNIYVRDNGARKEAFTGITGGVPSDNTLQDWGGDLFMWQRQYQVRRSGNDTIHAGAAKHQGTSIGVSTSPAAPSILQSKNAIEGGIKYMSFYWMQWGAASNCTRRIVVYADGTKIGEQEHPNGTEGRSGDEFLLGINNAMQSNKQLIIKNESYKGSVETLADNNCRIVMDTIYITPWLLYTNKDKQIMRIGGTYTRTPNINNTAGETGELSYISSNTEVATVNSSGQVTAVARGEATITAKFKWNETDSVTTSYKVEVFPVNCETFSQNATAHTYNTAEYGYSYVNPASVVEDKCTWYAWLGGVVPSNYEPNVAVIRAPHTDEQGPAYIRSGELTGGIGSMTFDWNLVADENNINWDIRVLVNGREVKQLGNADLSMSVLSNFGQITIDDINEPGNFVITFENHSTVTSGEYTEGNKARFVIDNVTWTSYSGAKTLYENMDNSSWLTAHDGETLDVAISRSALQSGKWNTLCLPFAISKSTDLGGAEVQRMTSATLNSAGDELEIVFTEHTDDELVAGTPYLVKPSSNIDISKTYTNKPISMIASPVVQGIVTLQGIFSPTELVANDQSTLFVGEPDGEGNNLFYPGVTGDLKGFRAYFKIGSGASPAPALRRARFVVNAHTTPTDAEEITNQKSQITDKVIIDGQLIIIRDGVKYNAMGQQIQ